MRLPSRTLLVAVLILLTAGAAACGSDEAVRSTGPDVYHVTQERHGARIDLVVGQRLAVVLPSIAGSSSRWTPREYDRSVLRQTSGTRTVGGRHGGMIIGGARAYEKILFEAVRPGATRLRLTRARKPSEGGGTALFEIAVVVGGARRQR